MDRSRPRVSDEPQSVVMPQILVSSGAGAPRIVRTVVRPQPGCSSGQKTTALASTANQSSEPLVVHVGGAGIVLWMYRAVPLVSPVQTAPVGLPTLYVCPPPDLVSAMQVEAISQAIMAQMLGMLECFQAQVSNLMSIDYGEC